MQITCQTLLNLFSNQFLSAHPVWILLGEINYNEQIATKMIDTVKHKLHINDVRIFELSQKSLPDILEFLSIHSVVFKIMVCIIHNHDNSVTSALLKKLEDIPKDICVILVAANIPNMLLTRGMMFQVIPEDIYSSEIVQLQLLLEKGIINFMNNDRMELVAIGYQTWHKVLEVRKWLQRKQITEMTAIEMTKSILEVAQLNTVLKKPLLHQSTM